MRPRATLLKRKLYQEEESSDEEYLDDAFVAGGFVHEDEDGDTGRVPSGDELESDEESLESLSRRGRRTAARTASCRFPQNRRRSRSRS